MGQSAPVGNCGLAQVGAEDDRRFVGPLQRLPELAGFGGFGGGGSCNLNGSGGGPIVFHQGEQGLLEQGLHYSVEGHDRAG